MANLIKDGVIKEAPTGFSWTTLVFGFIPAFMRGDIKWGIIMLLVAMVTGGISWLVFPFIYNKIYIKSLLTEGFSPRDKETEGVLRGMGVYDKDLFDNAVESVSNLGQKETGSKNGVHAADELRKWQELLKDGAITQKEYEDKKTEILKKS